VSRERGANERRGKVNDPRKYQETNPQIIIHTFPTSDFQENQSPWLHPDKLALGARKLCAKF